MRREDFPSPITDKEAQAISFIRIKERQKVHHTPARSMVQKKPVAL